MKKILEKEQIIYKNKEEKKSKNKFNIKKIFG